jgi:N-acetyl-anhydromuramyl-L-alanine amidase AmpD
MGDFSRQRPTPKQLAALKVLLRWLVAAHGINPKNILGHHHLKYTSCPGKYLNDPWDPQTPLQAIRTELLIESLKSTRR